MAAKIRTACVICAHKALDKQIWLHQIFSTHRGGLLTKPPGGEKPDGFKNFFMEDTK